MTAPSGPPGAGYEFSTAERIGQRVALGCLTIAGGTAGGFMLGTMVSKAVGSIRNCQPAEGLPACNYWLYAVPGALLGLVLVPAITFWRLHLSQRSTDTP
jgi:hypothetical protein